MACRSGSSHAGTSKEMEAAGMVGLYLKESRELFEWEKPAETDVLARRCEVRILIGGVK